MLLVTCVSLSLQITFCEQKTRQENSTLFSQNKLLLDWDWKRITWFEEKYFEWLIDNDVNIVTLRWNLLRCLENNFTTIKVYVLPPTRKKVAKQQKASF